MRSSKARTVIAIPPPEAIDDPTMQLEMKSGDVSTLIAALEALLRERAMAYQIASDYLARRHQPQIDQTSFGLAHVICLKRLLEARLDDVKQATP
ncbi:hypothetical protein [Caballeronia sp. HLA56]